MQKMGKKHEGLWRAFLSFGVPVGFLKLSPTPSWKFPPERGELVQLSKVEFLPTGSTRCGRSGELDQPPKVEIPPPQKTGVPVP